MKKPKSKPKPLAPPRDRHQDQKARGWRDVLLRLNPQDVSDLDALSEPGQSRAGAVRMLIGTAANRLAGRVIVKPWK